MIWDNGDSMCVCVWFHFKSGMEGAFNIDPLKRANRSSDIASHNHERQMSDKLHLFKY